MARRASDLIRIPESFWQRPETVAALQERDIGHLFLLVTKYTHASQTQIAIACGTTQPKISAIINGIQQVEYLSKFEEIADALEMPDTARVALGLAPRGPSHPAVPAAPSPGPIPSGDTGAGWDAGRLSDLLSLDEEDGQEEDPVRRRSFIGLAGASMLGTMLTGIVPGDRIKAEPLAPALTGHTPELATGQAGAAPDIASLAAAAKRARRDYQACHYSDLLKYLPDLLAQLHDAAQALQGNARLRVHALSADAHHVAAGLLLKLDDQGLAYLAADRSMRAARASEDPLVIGASARIITHTLMSGGHLASASATARSYATQLDHNVEPHTPESLSVYGSILLRGAIAAAQDEDRDTAHELLAEADETGQRLGVDGNLVGTGFGPTNARQHRVNIAVTLGDAGTAVNVARGIDVSAIKLTERKASLLIDTARAFLQWGKHEKAYTALRTAEQVAHEEVTGRPAVHRLVRDLATTAPPGVQRDARQFASQIGAGR